MMVQAWLEGHQEAEKDLCPALRHRGGRRSKDCTCLSSTPFVVALCTGGRWQVYH